MPVIVGIDIFQFGNDVLGNVWEEVDDCWNGSYVGAPRDGSAWWQGICSLEVVRGGAWLNGPMKLRSASRGKAGRTYNYVGFRVARTLAP